MMNWFLSQETLRRPTNYAKNMLVNVSAILNPQNSAGFILRFIVMVCQYLYVNMEISMIFDSGFLFIIS